MMFSEFVLRLYNLNLFPLFCGYLVLCFCSPLWKRVTYPATQLKLVTTVYSAVCSVFSLYVACGLIYGIFSVDKIFVNSESPIITPYLRLYAFTKILELMDTVFMMLRHKTNQISFLHVFHHSSMLILVQYALQYSAWTALAPVLMLNSVVHVFLYFYYGYSAYYGSVPLFWKKKLTQIQLIQFLIGVVYTIKGYTQHEFCVWSIVYTVLMIVLFSNFYYNTYYQVRSSQPHHDGGDRIGSAGSGASKRRE